MFIWCLASWDVLGVYPESTDAEGSYHDPVIGSIIQAHNKAMRQGNGGGSSGSSGGSGQQAAASMPPSEQDIKPAAAGRR